MEDPFQNLDLDIDLLADVVTLMRLGITGQSAETRAHAFAMGEDRVRVAAWALAMALGTGLRDSHGGDAQAALDSLVIDPTGEAYEDDEQ